VSAETTQKILVVDDELDTRIFLLNLLKASGFHPITANNKAEGLKKAVTECPSVIILNMMMPGESGIRLYQQLKQDDALNQIPIIMLSTLDKDTFLKCHNLYGYRQSEANKRIDRFMEKPVETEDLLATVQDLSALVNELSEGSRGQGFKDPREADS
jgi:CheY-like chemotaxis protein